LQEIDSAIKRVLWWICLLVAPAVLIALELFHPAGFTASPGMYQYLSHTHGHEPPFMALGAALLLAFGWELQTAHAAPHGPIAVSLLILATLSIWWTQRRRAYAAQ